MKAVVFDGRHDTAIELPPAVELIADSAIVCPGHPLFLPESAGEWTGRVMLAFRISRLGKGVAEKFANRYFDAMTLALLPENVALEQQLRSRCLPAGICGCIDGAAVMGKWMALPAEDEELTVELDGLTAKIAEPLVMCRQAIAALAHYATLKMGDILMPVSVATGFPLVRRHEFKASLNGDEVLAVRMP